jgi:hypothetical protein
MSPILIGCLLLALLAWSLFLLSTLGRLSSGWLARFALREQLVRLWLASCAVAAMWTWALAITATTIVIVVLFVGERIGDELTTGLLGLFIAGPLAGLALDRAKAVRSAYWNRISATLDAAIPDAPSTADERKLRTIYNLEKRTLESSDSLTARRNARTKILKRMG